MASFSVKIGADIPAFIMGKTAIVEGIGDILHPIQRKEKWYLIVYPLIQILTKNMFKSPYLKKNNSKKSMSSLLKLPFSNDFENIVKKDSRIIKELVSMLSSYAPTRITGTGSCIFSEFDNKESAQKIFSLIPKNMKKFIAKSMNTSLVHHFCKKINFIY